MGESEAEGWDELEDDREFDVAEKGSDDDESDDGEDDKVRFGRDGRRRCYGLNVNLRERLAVARLRLGDLQEAEVRERCSPLDHSH